MSLPQLNVPDLLKRHNLRPDKSLGQNFLIDQSALQRVAEAAEINQDDRVLEIGAGLGSLTRLLAAQAKQVVAVELDDRLVPLLKEILETTANVQIIQADILKLNLKQIFDSPGYLVVANIPYYITSLLIRHLIEASHRPSRLVLTVQNEVAERICALPGKLSLLALSVQVYGDPYIKTHIPAGAFYPAPKVDSAVVRVDLYPEPRIPTPSLPLFFRLAKAGFSQKRKTLRNALSGGMRWSPQQAVQILSAANIDPMRRAETLSLEEWGNLTGIAGRESIPK